MQYRNRQVRLFILSVESFLTKRNKNKNERNVDGMKIHLYCTHLAPYNRISLFLLFVVGVVVILSAILTKKCCKNQTIRVSSVAKSLVFIIVIILELLQKFAMLNLAILRTKNSVWFFCFPSIFCLAFFFLNFILAQFKPTCRVLLKTG